MSPKPFTPNQSDKNPLPVWLRWIPTSPELLLEAEEKLLKRVKCSLESSFVPISGESCYLRTIIAHNHDKKQKNCTSKSAEESNAEMPMVLIHGFASGVALWCKNIDSFAAHRTVFAFDVLGFGRSSRPQFSSDAEEAEKQFVDSVENWRKAMNLEKFILLGHSLGGFIATSYAISYPGRISHLILVDPWGFLEAPSSEQLTTMNKQRSWLFRAVRNITQNPLTWLRAAGPLGRKLIHRFRQDLRGVFDQRNMLLGECIEVPDENDELALKKGAFFTTATTTTDSDQPSSDRNSASSPDGSRPTGSSANAQPLDPDDLDGSVALDYVYQINVQRPSGELGFISLCNPIPWPKRPMLFRMGDLEPNVPITFIYGSRSWLDTSSGVKTRNVRPGSYVDIKIIEGAGHQVYAEAAEEFNAYVNAVAEQVDRNEASLTERHEQRRGKHNSGDISLPDTATIEEQHVHRKRSLANVHKSPTSIDPPNRGPEHDASDEASD